jgi:hypothetical protein
MARRGFYDQAQAVAARNDAIDDDAATPDCL